MKYFFTPVIAILPRLLLQIATMTPLVTSRPVLTLRHRSRSAVDVLRPAIAAASANRLPRRGRQPLLAFYNHGRDSSSSHEGAAKSHRRPLSFATTLASSNYDGRGTVAAPSMILSRRTATRHPPHPRDCRRRFGQRKGVPPSLDTVREERNDHRNPNRYERFRQCLASSSSSSSSSAETALVDDATDLVEVGRRAAEVLSSNRRSFNRTWKRMKPLVELIALACDGDDDGNVDESSRAEGVSSIADVGCDHGILSISLACMALAARRDEEGEEDRPDGCEDHRDNFFSRVIGADVSSQALENGGLVSLRKMEDVLMRTKRGNGPLPVEFRLGDGLEPLRPGEADAVVLAGMGVHTMMEVLFGTNETSSSDDAIPPVDRVRTRRIFLQPTNSRPQHMMLLYDRLQRSGEWTPRGESVAYLGGRWYINSSFERRDGDDDEDAVGDRRAERPFRFPGEFLARGDDSDSDGDGGAYDAYVRHHLRWLREDYERPRGDSLEEEDGRWLEYVRSAEENARWKSLASWYP